MNNIPITHAKNLKEKPDPNTLVFGHSFTDHMFLMDYHEGKGWHDPRIVPYGPLSLDPSSIVFHYAQEAFEGMKAYRRPDGKLQFFRPMENVRRLNTSLERLYAPTIPEDLLYSAIAKLVDLEQEWTPYVYGSSLYIRPFVIATDNSLGVHCSSSYLLCIILCPVGCYYPEGLNPVKIYVEEEDVRAVRGGMGFAKVGANYAASLRAATRAQKVGYSQVLWLDGVERKYVEEVGAMNVMFHLGDEVVTPSLTGSVLSGITRKSCLELLGHWGIKTNERLVSAEELFVGAENGQLHEGFGTGTAAVIAPIGEMGWGQRHTVVSGGEIGPLAQRLYDTLTRIQWGLDPDPFGWTMTL